MRKGPRTSRILKDVPVSEEEWLTLLNSVPDWNMPQDPMVIVVPHPDDETLGAGGMIAAARSREIDVTVVAVTDGERAYGDDTGLAAVRRVEQAEALKRLGVHPDKVARLGLPDSNVASREDDLVQMLSGFVRPETHVVATWKGDRHPDHEACGRAAELVCARAGASLSSYFFWTWHWGELAPMESLKLRRFTLTDREVQAKAEALQCHRSQLVHPGGKPILPETLLGPARRPFEVFAIA